MPLQGSGALIGLATLAAIGNPDPSAIPVFGAMDNALATWALGNLGCTPGTMISAGTAVSGFGGLAVSGSVATNASVLGPLLASAVKDPSAGGIKTWTAFAAALIGQFITYGQVVGSTFVAPSPGPGPLTGTGTVLFTSTSFSPPLGTQLGVTDASAIASLASFGAQTLLGIALNAIIVPIATLAPFIPFTSPVGGGPIIGGGSLT